MSDKRQQLIALCEFIILAQTLPADPLDLISAVIEENRRLDAELRQRRFNCDLDIQAIRQRAQSCPPLSLHITDDGGVVLINGPFPLDQAQACQDFISKARLDILRLAEIVETGILNNKKA